MKLVLVPDVDDLDEEPAPTLGLRISGVWLPPGWRPRTAPILLRLWSRGSAETPDDGVVDDGPG